MGYLESHKDFIENSFSEPIMEEDMNVRSLRSGSITHGNEMSFLDFADLFKTFRFKSFSDLIPKL